MIHLERVHKNYGSLVDSHENDADHCGCRGQPIIDNYSPQKKNIAFACASGNIVSLFSTI